METQREIRKANHKKSDNGQNSQLMKQRKWKGEKYVRSNNNWQNEEGKPKDGNTMKKREKAKKVKKKM